MQGPSSKNGSGRVEIFYQGEWGTVCDDGWGMYDAIVACRQLGYKYAVRILHKDDVPDGSGQIWLENVNCSGSEKTLASCGHNGWGVHDCYHREDVGIECSSAGKSVIIVFFAAHEKRLQTPFPVSFQIKST